MSAFESAWNVLKNEEAIHGDDITEMTDKLSGLGYKWCERCGYHYDDLEYHLKEQCSYPHHVVPPATDVDSMRETLVGLGYRFK